jgi:hypothetical protein
MIDGLHIRPIKSSAMAWFSINMNVGLFTNLLSLNIEQMSKELPF